MCSLQENKNPLELMDLPDPEPEENEVLVKVSACGVCHTELDEIEGRTPPPSLPVVPGHEVVGIVEDAGKHAKKFKKGDRVGIGWIHSACGECKFCLRGNENLCENFAATGRDANGGYAEYITVPEDSAFIIPEEFSDPEAAPLLCAGSIGYRSLSLTQMKNGQNLGLTGFGASAHLVLKMARHKYPDSRIFVFARSKKERDFAVELGAVWAGDTEEESPEKLHCIIDTTPVWKPILEGLKNLEGGGRLVINAIRKEDIDKNYLLKMDYPSHLWLEKEIKSVANVTRKDISEFLILASKIAIRPEIEEFSLADANKALIELKERKIRGAKVLKMY
ncbi:MAG TPA: zinc-dependent alcohol dehydrogenase family protein [Desulfobacteraceae bacterium]|nr:zinc-dependent alcohol dehydrogenase family protein [Desulfobacteraceae bacterium]HPQ29558.1 zinc-dependent alcohol dehydrogenase family protein [Desulfobacteraceae bacterium]